MTEHGLKTSMQEQVSELPIRPAVRLERLLWLIALLLAWAVAQAALAAAGASAGGRTPTSTGSVWMLLPLAVIAFEIWVIGSALRLRRRSRRAHRIELDAEEIRLPPFGLSRRGARVRYEDITGVERRGFGGAARVLIRHRHGRSIVPVAQVDEVALRKALTARLPTSARVLWREP